MRGREIPRLLRLFLPGHHLGLPRAAALDSVRADRSQHPAAPTDLARIGANPARVTPSLQRGVKQMWESRVPQKQDQAAAL